MVIGAVIDAVLELLNAAVTLLEAGRKPPAARPGAPTERELPAAPPAS